MEFAVVLMFKELPFGQDQVQEIFDRPPEWKILHYYGVQTEESDTDRKYHREGFDMGLVLQSLLKIPEMGVPFSHFLLTTYTCGVV